MTLPRPSILCDIGNVLVHFDFSVAAQRLAAQSDVPADRILRLLDEAKEELESGKITGDAFITRSIKESGFRGSREEFHHLWCDIFSANDPMHRTIERLRGERPLYLLSNTSDLHKDYLFATFPVFENFDGCIYSYSARAAKPDEEIFRHTIAELGLDPAQTLFIDDLAANIATAQRLGFVTAHYDATNHQDFEEFLADWMLRSEITPAPGAEG
ncbi:MAG: HAD family phosphatase [Verrucomicrobiales bacterium]|nr:HAD family phosphatase [Verrucomicrobiales bacterium]